MSVLVGVVLTACAWAQAQAQNAPAAHPIVLHAARLLDVESGKMFAPGEVLVEGERIVAAGASMAHPARSGFAVRSAPGASISSGSFSPKAC